LYRGCYQQIHYAEDIPLLFRLTARCEDGVRKIVSATSRGQDPDQQTTKAQYDLAVQVARYVLQLHAVYVFTVQFSCRNSSGIGA
jgi:hypothetical protein